MFNLDGKYFEYNDLLVPTYSRLVQKGYLISMFGDNIGEEYLFLKQLLGGSVILAEFEEEDITVDENDCNKIKEQITFEDFKVCNFKSLRLSEDNVLNCILQDGIVSYLTDVGVKDFWQEYNKLVHILAMLDKSFKCISMKIIGTKVVYYGDLILDLVEYFKYLNHIGLDVVYLSNNLDGYTYFQEISDLCKFFGECGVNTTISEMLKKVTVFKTRSRASVDKLMSTPVSKYTKIIRRLSNSIFDFTSLYDIEVCCREYYEKDDTNKIEYIPIYACNIVGYKEAEFNELVNYLVKVEDTVYIKHNKDILIDVATTKGTDVFGEMGGSIDFDRLVVREGSKFFREYNIEYVNALIKNIAKAMEEEDIHVSSYSSKNILRNILYSLLESKISLDCKGKITKYLINNYNCLMNNLDFRLLARTLLYCGKDVVVLSAKGEIDGFTNIVLGDEVYSIEGKEGEASLLNISLSISSIYDNRNKVESIWSRLWSMVCRRKK